MMKLAIVALCVAFCTTGASASPLQPPLLNDPYQIYARTRSAWSAQHYPDYVGYTIHVEVDERGTIKSKHYHAVYEQPTGKVHLMPVSDEELAQPPSPTGMTIHLLPKRQNVAVMDKRVGNPGEAVDYLGIPLLSPNYSFGLGLPLPGQTENSDDLVTQIRRQYHDPMPPIKAAQAAANGELKSIASITAIAHQYRIELAGVDKVEGKDCYHLVMHPAREPQRFRLRQIWIEVESYQTRRLLTANNFMNSNVPWLVTFNDVAGARYIESEVAQAPVGVGEHRFVHASISFESITATQRPGTAFESTFMTSENVIMEPHP